MVRGDRLPRIGTCMIGRSPHISPVLDDHKGSRRHVLVHAQGGSMNRPARRSAD